MSLLIPCRIKGHQQSWYFAMDKRAYVMTTSSNWNIFRVTGQLCGEFTGDRWIPNTKAMTRSFDKFLWFVPWINRWVNNRDDGDWRYHRAYYDVIVMITWGIITCLITVSANDRKCKFLFRISIKLFINHFIDFCNDMGHDIPSHWCLSKSVVRIV